MGATLFCVERNNMITKFICSHCEQLYDIANFKNKSLMSWRVRKPRTDEHLEQNDLEYYLCSACYSAEGPLSNFYGYYGTCDVCGDAPRVPLWERWRDEDEDDLIFVCEECSIDEV